MTGRRMAVVVALSAACHASLARADDSRAHDDAVRVATDGAALYDHGHYYEALGKFADAYRLFPAPPLIINLVRTELKLGHCDQAFDYARRYSSLSRSEPIGGSPDAELERVAGACSSAEIVSDPTGASIEIDRERRGWSLTPWTGHLTLGTHAVVARLAGHPDQLATLVVTQGSITKLEIKFNPPAVAGGATEETAAPVKNPVLKTVGWVAVAVGGAALVTGAVVYGVGRSQQNAIHNSPNPQGGAAALKALSTANAEVSGSAAPFVIGGVLTAGGIGIEVFF